MRRGIDGTTKTQLNRRSRVGELLDVRSSCDGCVETDEGAHQMVSLYIKLVAIAAGRWCEAGAQVDQGARAPGSSATFLPHSLIPVTYIFLKGSGQCFFILIHLLAGPVKLVQTDFMGDQLDAGACADARILLDREP